MHDNLENIYSMIDDVLRHHDNDKNAAESHGMLCGLYCGAGENIYLLWEQELIGNAKLTDAERAIFKQLHSKTCELLNSDNFTFNLLLPNDEQALQLRTEALGNWCQGYLLGLSLAGAADLKSFSASVNEFMEDLLEITHAGDYLIQEKEQDEQAFMEIVEYVRAGVQLVKDEMFASHHHQNSLPH